MPAGAAPSPVAAAFLAKSGFELPPPPLPLCCLLPPPAEAESEDEAAAAGILSTTSSPRFSCDEKMRVVE